MSTSEHAIRQVSVVEPVADGDSEIPADVFRRRWTILGVLCTSLLIIVIGNTSLNVALPKMSEALGLTNSQQQWVVDAYSLVFAGMLFTAGTIGDRFGRKGALQFGLVLFLIGTSIAAVGHGSGQIIVARAVMGFAAAFVMPSTLSILTNVFPAHERPKAIAIWAGISGAGAAIGPVTSGFLLEHFWWGAVFLVNVPMIILALVAGAILVPTSKDPDEHKLDAPGALLSIIGLGSLVYAIIEGPYHGWGSLTTLGTFALSIVALGLFALRELTAEHPMLDLRYFRDRRFSVASGGMMLTFFAMFGSFFLVAQYFQLVLGYSPFESGLLLLPMAITMMAIAPQVPKLVARFGAARVVPFGLGLTGFGLFMFSTLGVHTPVWHVYFAIIPMAAGMASTMTPLTTLIMASVPLTRAGVGSAMNDTTRELGGALGVAVLGTLVSSRFLAIMGPKVAALPAAAKSVALSGLAGSLGVASDKHVPHAAGVQLANAAKSAFVDGVGVATMVGSAVVLVAAVAAWFLLPRGAAAPQATGLPSTAIGSSGDFVDALDDDADEALVLDPIATAD